MEWQNLVILMESHHIAIKQPRFEESDSDNDNQLIIL